MFTQGSGRQLVRAVEHDQGPRLRKARRAIRFREEGLVVTLAWVFWPWRPLDLLQRSERIDIIRCLIFANWTGAALVAFRSC
jgi:hypothetical protein